MPCQLTLVVFYRIAGSETTATALACITYYLQQNPEVLRNLRKEIRSSYDCYEEINDSSTVGLHLMNAVILEGMRMYPPLPFPLPRVVPEGGSTIDGHYVPAGVSLPASSRLHQPQPTSARIELT